MTEQIQTIENGKRQGIVRRIIRWLWILLLSALLILGLFFAAPWKVILLIIIFLAAATILPRVYRKYFWICVVAIIIVVVIWVFIPQDEKDWRPYTFDKELANLQARYVVPYSENAAIAYQKIFTEWKRKEANGPNLPDCWQNIALKGPWSGKDNPEIGAHILYYNDILEDVSKAANIEKCSFPITADILYLDRTERSSSARQCAYLLIASGNKDIADGNIKEAIEKFITVIRIGQHLSKQPENIDVLVSFACEGLSLDAINNLVINSDIEENNLKQLEMAVSSIKHDWNTDSSGFIEVEKLMLKNMMGGIFYEINSKGKTRFCRDDPLAMMRDKFKDWPDVSGYWWKRLFRTYSILYWLYAPSTPKKLGEIIDSSYAKNYLMNKPDLDWSKAIESINWNMNFRQQADLLTQMNYQTIFGLHDSYLNNQSRQKGTLLIMALRRYKNANGHWPEKLEDVNNFTFAENFIDPLNDDAFIYNVTDDNFIIYSIGKNNIDENGEYELKQPLINFGKVENHKDDVMIWPRNKTKKQEVNKDNDK